MTRLTPTLVDRIRYLSPCDEAVRWLAKQKTPTQAWLDCKRGDWMLWIIGTQAGPPLSDARRTLVLCACECAWLSLKYFEDLYPNDTRPRRAIETAEKWAKSGARAATHAAAAAAAAAHAAIRAATRAAADAARAAARAAYDADAADAADAERQWQAARFMEYLDGRRT